MGGVPQTLVSKFKISYNLLLNLYFTNNLSFNEFANNSMVTEDINQQVTYIESEIHNIEESIVDKKKYLQLLKTTK